MSLVDLTFLANVILFTLISSYILLDVDLTNGLIRAHTSKATSLLIIPAYVFLRAIYSILIYPTYIDLLRHIPSGPQEGLLDRFFAEPEAPEYEAWLNTVPNSGLIRHYGRLNQIQILVTTPAGCEEVLQAKAACFPKQPSTRKILKMWLGTDTLLSSTTGEGHKELRKRLLPAFYARNIKEVQPVFWEKAMQMREALYRVVKYNNDRVLEVNLDDLIDRAALDGVGLAGHGVDFDTLREPKGRLGQLHKRAFDLGTQELQVVLSALFLPDWVFEHLPFKVYRDNRAGVKALRAYCRDIIREDVASKNTTEKNIVGMASQMDTFSEDDLVDLSMDLLVAGHKTISSALQIAFYTLAQYPEVQSRLREEIQQAYPNMSSRVLPDSSADVKLPYLEAVLNELFRIYPPLANMVRLSVSTTTICGVLIPAGSKVVVSQWAMNRSHAQWGSDAAAFRPERWLEGARPHLLTFSKGPRNCIGEGFARTELAVLVSAIIERFELSIVQGDEDGEVRKLEQGITLKVKGGCRVGVRVLKD